MTEPLADSPVFTARYDQANARLARTRLNQCLVADLEKFSRVAAKTLAAEAQELLAALPQVDPSLRLPPALYLWHQALLGALKAQDVAAARKGLAELTAAAKSAPLKPGEPFQVDTIEPDTALTDALEEISLQELVPDPTSASGLMYLQQIRIEPTATDAYPQWVEEGMGLVGRAAPQVAAEVGELVYDVRFFDGPGPSLSSTRTFGTVFLATPEPGYHPVHYVIEHLTHEASHHTLFALMGSDPMLVNGHDGRYASPIRSDPRPLYGIFHQVFVLARLIHLWRDLVGAGESWAAVRLRNDEGRFAEAEKVVREHAELTAAGRLVLDSCTQMAADG